MEELMFLDGATIKVTPQQHTYTFLFHTPHPTIDELITIVSTYGNTARRSNFLAYDGATLSYRTLSNNDDEKDTVIFFRTGGENLVVKLKSLPFP